MTSAFVEFMQQHGKTGSEKADGYRDELFSGLSEGEKGVVFELLVKELPWSAKWLLLVNRDKAVSVIKEKENKLRGDGYEHVYMLQQLLVKYTGDLKYQSHMLEDYNFYIDRLKPLVVDAVSRTPVNKATVNFLKEVILVETNSSAVARASRHFLAALRVANGSDFEKDECKRFEKELRGESTQEKQKIFAELEKYEKAMFPDVQKLV